MVSAQATSMVKCLIWLGGNRTEVCRATNDFINGV
jgi:hypothetical protein